MSSAEHGATRMQMIGDHAVVLAPPQQVMALRILWRVLRGTVRRPQVPPTESAPAAAAPKVT